MVQPLTKEQLEKVEELLRSDQPDKFIAAQIGLDPRTFKLRLFRTGKRVGKTLVDIEPGEKVEGSRDN